MLREMYTGIVIGMIISVEPYYGEASYKLLTIVRQPALVKYIHMVRQKHMAN